jgi:phage tail-like protein
MTHPADKVYRFSKLKHWGQGLAQDFLFGAGAERGLVTPGAMEVCRVATAPKGESVLALAADLCGRLLWLLSDGTVMAAHEAGAVQVAVLPRSAVHGVRRLIWGQRTAWVVSGDAIVRLDARSGDRTGGFGVPGWQVVDAVADRCDGVIVVEVARETMRLRQIRPEGRARVLATHEGFTRVMVAVRWEVDGPVHVLDQVEGGFRVVTFASDGSLETTHDYTVRVPLGPVTMDGPGRLVMAAKGGGVSTVAFGLMEPVREIRTTQPMAKISALLWKSGVLYAAAGRKVWALREAPGTADSKTATWFGPVLHSPFGERSGWLRADLWADLPQGVRVRIASRSFENAAAAAAYNDALRSAPGGPLLRESWKLDAASEHFGDGTERPLRHYLGDETAEYLALRLEVSVPACTDAARFKRLDVLYPNRSLIEDLPAIYRTGTQSERQMRRMLSPFQALADEIDELIGESIRRVDPQKTDDLWTGFLLSWLGHGEFSRLPAGPRKDLLIALPEILQWRGTMAGLVRVMQILSPEGFSIEDSGQTPDIWILPKPMDPAGARLGRETRAARHQPQAMVLGNCAPLGTVVLDHACLDLVSLDRCSAVVTVRVHGDRARLEPFAERIARVFVPANTTVRFVYGDHHSPDLLERGAGTGPGDGGDALIRLDDEESRALGAWRLPRKGPSAPEHSPVLNSAVLDGSLTLE